MSKRTLPSARTPNTVRGRPGPSGGPAPPPESGAQADGNEAPEPGRTVRRMEPVGPAVSGSPRPRSGLRGAPTPTSPWGQAGEPRGRAERPRAAERGAAGSLALCLRVLSG